MAHKKGAGSTKNGRDSNSKRFGIKVYTRQQIKKSAIIVRQRGLTIRPGIGVSVGKDFTIFASSVGVVKFTSKKLKFVSILPTIRFLWNYILEYVRNTRKDFNTKLISWHNLRLLLN